MENMWTTPVVWPFIGFEDTLSAISETLQNVQISVFTFCSVVSVSILTILAYKMLGNIWTGKRHTVESQPAERKHKKMVRIVLTSFGILDPIGFKNVLHGAILN